MALNKILHKCRNKNSPHMNSTDFIKYIVMKHNITFKEATFIYDTFLDAVKDVIFNNMSLVLRGFGKFYLQTHKGHPVHFNNVIKGDSNKAVANDYLVFKFSAASTLNKSLRDEIAQCNNEDN